MLAYRRIGVIELIASTAAAYDPISTGYWAERPLRRQFYSVMPQAVCVWARQAGCQVEYATYYGQVGPLRLLSSDLDLVFIAAPTQQSALAYALCRFYHRNGATVVLAGPHARAFPADSIVFADIVVTDCDQELVLQILHGHVDHGTLVKSARPLKTLPLVEERLPEIRKAAYNGGRKLAISTIATLASLGCPYACDFCSEWATAYTATDTDRFNQDLDFISKRFPGALIGFHDPNFGVRFDQTLSAFEAIPAHRRNPFVMECTLSLLNPERLRRLRDVNCLMVAPGIESWADYSNKTRAGKQSGAEKYKLVNDKIRELTSYIPTVQANIILGVDADAGETPFDLTRAFILEHDVVWTNVNIPLPFGGTPFAERVQREGRLVEALPHMFYCAPYVVMRPRHYSVPEYLDRLTKIYALLVSKRLLVKSLNALQSWLYRGVWLGRTIALQAELVELRKFRRALAESSALQRFYENSSQTLPAFYVERYRRRLGRLAELVPLKNLTPISPAEREAHDVVTV